MTAADLIIRGGLVVDGTGREPFVGDVAIRAGCIIEVGPRVALSANEEVDATGFIVAPGFVDLHTHLDGQVFWDPLCSPAGAAGVTTVIAGNCGVGFAPCRKDMREFAMQLMEGVEDVPRSTLREGLPWDWETFPEYLDALERRHLACDIGVFIAHGCIRAFVMGEEQCNLSDRPGGPFKHPVSEEDIQAMREVVREAVQAGALGFSTNRLQGHRDSKGTCVPGTLGSNYEYTQLALGVAQGGGGVSQVVSDYASYDDRRRADLDPKLCQERGRLELQAMEFVSKKYGLKVLVSAGLPNDSKTSAFATMEFFRSVMNKANASGGDMCLQTFARPQALLTSWESRHNFFRYTDAFKQLKDLPLEEQRARLQEPETRSEMLQEMEGIVAGKSKPRLGDFVRSQWDEANLSWHFLMDEDFDYEPPPSKCLVAVARATGRGLLETMYDVLAANAGRGMTWRPSESYAGQDLETMREWLLTPGVVPGISDTGAHLALFQDGCAPTFMLTHWVKGRTRGPKIGLQEAVRLQTHDTARAVGLVDRGTLEPGMKADINIIDLDRLRILAPTYEHDLPAGAPRWMQAVEGYKMTLVSGVPTFRDGRPTGKLPGRLVRNPFSMRRSLPEPPAVFKDLVRQRILESLGKVEAAEGGEETGAAEAVARTLAEGNTGPTHMSRVQREASKL